jgi:selenide,water dikinase
LLQKDVALVQTVDFFTPIVDDPLWFGRIAAANALSDVYAMGGRPHTAMNLLCYPEEMGPEVMMNILAGGLEKIKEAKAVLVGGHSVKDKELKYGLSVTGTVSPQRVFSNDKLRVGQKLVLTKKLGTGVITTAAKSGKASQEDLQKAMEQMAQLNEKACEIMLTTSATACTDITGFGFLGHLAEMARASRCRVKVFSSQIPVLDGVKALIKKGFVTGAVEKNREYVGPVGFGKNVDEVMQNILLDPQTSGGLLFGVEESELELVLSQMPEARWVGSVEAPLTNASEMAISVE